MRLHLGGTHLHSMRLDASLSLALGLGSLSLSLGVRLGLRLRLGLSLGLSLSLGLGLSLSLSLRVGLGMRKRLGGERQHLSQARYPHAQPLYLVGRQLAAEHSVQNNGVRRHAGRDWGRGSLGKDIMAPDRSGKRRRGCLWHPTKGKSLATRRGVSGSIHDIRPASGHSELQLQARCEQPHCFH